MKKSPYPKRCTSFYLPPQTKRLIKAMADAIGCSRSAVLEYTIWERARVMGITDLGPPTEEELAEIASRVSKTQRRLKSWETTKEA